MSFTEDPGRESPGEAGAETAAGGPGEAAAAPPAPVQPTPVEEAPAGSTQEPAAGSGRGGSNMLPERERRRFGLERVLVRLIATLGIIGIGVAIGAILVSSKVQGWITGLAVAAVSVVLSAILWSSKQL